MTDRITESTYVLFPHLMTTESVEVFGLIFRSTDDHTHLLPADAKHIERLSKMFYLSEGGQITKMMYAVLPSPLSPQLRNQLHFARQLIAYLIAPMPYEDAAMYTFVAEPFPESAIFIPHPQQRDGWKFTEPLASRLENKDSHYDLIAYAGEVNLRHWLMIAEDEKFVLPMSSLKSHSFLDLGHSMQWTFRSPENHALGRLVRTHPDATPLDSTLKRLMRAIEWYNQSNEEFVERAEITILLLTTAFESLLDLDFSDQIDVEPLQQGKGREKKANQRTSRFGEALHTILGHVQRLDDWAEQFYDVRSKIIHTGLAPSLMFNSPKISDKEESVAVEKHAAIGNRVFRSCLSTLLAGHYTAMDAAVDLELVHNEERLRRILRLLAKEDTAANKILAVAGLVAELSGRRNYFRRTQLVSKTSLLTASEKLLNLLVEARPDIPEPILKGLKDVASLSRDTEKARLMNAYVEVAKHLGAPNQPLDSNDHISIVREFAGYVSIALLTPSNT